MRQNMGIYRGKTEDGKWVEGGLYEHKPPLQDLCHVLHKSQWYIIRTAFADWNMPRKAEFIAIDPETVGEWIGLTDKNGKRIYEGDIISSKDGRGRYSSREDYIIGEVFYGQQTLSWQVSNRIKAKSCEILDSINDTLEVIGNIHGNPELVKE